jgi:hypothetical protein
VIRFNALRKDTYAPRRVVTADRPVPPMWHQNGTWQMTPQSFVWKAFLALVPSHYRWSVGWELEGVLCAHKYWS